MHGNTGAARVAQAAGAHQGKNSKNGQGLNLGGRCTLERKLKIIGAGC